MQLSTQVIQRNLSTFDDYQHLLVFGAPDAEVFSELPDNSHAASFDYKQFLANQQIKEAESCTFGLPGDGRYDAILIFMPKAKEELRFLLAAVLPLLNTDGDVYLVGEKKAGIASAAKLLNEYGKNASKIDSAKHCQLWHMNLDDKANAFVLDDWVSELELEVKGQSIKLAYLPGVFSHGRLDEGTALLLDHLPKKLRGRVLDFACGNGVIGIVAKKLFPEITLEQLDVSWLALECAKRSAAFNDIEAKIYPSDGWKAVEGRVDAVMTNPPFHEGVKTAYDTTERFIAESPKKMSKSAPMLLVANNFLRYPPLIERALGKCDTLAENTRFRLYYAFR